MSICIKIYGQNWFTSKTLCADLDKSYKSAESAESSQRGMFLYKQVPAERLSGLSGDFNF